MTIAELFVNIGVKGADTSAKALGTVERGMVGIKESSFAAKAAILAVVYGLERLTLNVAQEGTNLTHFAEATGLSAEELQKWQYAARQFGVSGEEVKGTVMGIQNAMTNMLLGKGAPEGLGMLANVVGFDPARARDTFYVLEQIQKFTKAVPPDIAKNMLKSFGINDEMFQMLKRTNYEVSKLKVGMFSASEASQLERVDVAWRNLGNSIKLTMGHLAAKYGLDAVNSLQRAFKFLEKSTSDIIKLSKAFPELALAAKTAGAAIAIAFAPITTLVAGTVWLLSELQKKKEGKDSAFGENGLFGRKGALMNMIMGDIPEDVANPNQPRKGLGPWSLPATPTREDAIRDVNNTVNQVLNINGVKNPDDVRNAAKKGVNDAYRQISAQAGGI